ncbi:MAG: MFS transporter [Chlamydiae bacterium]|nr:MFS transporter [Chlamydiota bacterium]
MSKHFPYGNQTKRAIFLSTLLNEPFASLYPLLPFILLKSLNATAFQIVILTMLKPVSSIFSLYWSEKISQNRHTLRMNLIGAGLLARVPFLLALLFDHVWLYVVASTLYMLFSRAGIPAWMEVLKVNLPDKIREKSFSFGSAIGYAEGVLIAIGIGSLLDKSALSWKVFFLFALVFGLLALLVQALLPLGEKKEMLQEKKIVGLKEGFLRPWIDCYQLMKKRSDFRKFQWAFMVGGFGLMVIQPVIPIFFTETLHISYRELLIAYSICKALGFVLTSHLWSRALSYISVNVFTSLVLVGFAIFPLVIVAAILHPYWIYVAYFIYGIAQAGSHLIWHLSGPLFAEGEKSLRYSGVNIVMVGIRGALGPPLGGVLVAFMGPVFVFLLSALFCLFGTAALFFRSLKSPSV